MSLIVAVPFGVASAVAYGGSTAVQHAAAHTGTGQADARRLVALLRDPRWLLSIGGDTVGFILQIVALANGPVVLVQPLLVLSLPVALFLRAVFDGKAPPFGDYVSCAGIIAGLSVFLVLLGSPHSGHLPMPHDLQLAVGGELVGTAVLCAAVRRRGPVPRAAAYGGAAGVLFGTLGVLINSTSVEFDLHGLHGVLTRPDGYVPLVGVVLLGALGMVLLQVSFQVGALAASLPANLAAEPVAAVVLGAVLLEERVPRSAAAVVVYVGCLVAIIAGAVRLAGSRSPSPSPGVARSAP